MEYLTPQELVDRYRNTISLGTLANWRSSGRGPEFVRLGGRVVYRVEDVLAWEKSRRSNLGEQPQGKRKAAG